MNILFGGLPEEVEICGEMVPINSDFRIGILFEDIVLDRTLEDDEKIETALRLYFGDEVQFVGADAIREAMNKILWFYRCGEDEKKDEKDKNGKPIFSYEHDAAYIYEAFLSAYKIDLTTEKLHWWQFRALFGALPEDVMFMKIVGYRAMKIPNKLPKEQKEFYQKMKRIHELPLPKEEQDFNNDLIAALMTGNGLQDVLGIEDAGNQ